jgi:hypothetical protein
MTNIIWTGLMGKTATTLGWQTNTVNFSPCQVTATVALASYGALMLGKAVALTLLGFAGWTYRRLTLRRIGQGGEAMLGRRCTPRHVMAGCGRTGFRDQRRSRRLRGLQLTSTGAAAQHTQAGAHELDDHGAVSLRSRRAGHLGDANFAGPYAWEFRSTRSAAEVVHSPGLPLSSHPIMAAGLFFISPVIF